MTELVKRHLAALSADNWVEYRAGLTDNAVYEEVATGLRAAGADKYEAAVRMWKKAFPDLKAKVINSFDSGDQVVAEVEWEGTQSGPLDTPLGTIPPTNKHGTIQGVLIAKIKDGKIAEMRQYFDALSLMKQLNVLPANLPMVAPPKSIEVRH